MEGLVESLKGLSRQAQAVARDLESYRALSADPVNKAYERAAALKRLRKSAAGLPEPDPGRRVQAALEAEEAAVEQAKGEFRFQFGRRLVAGLEGTGMNVRGQLPLIRAGLFTVRADFDAGTAAAFWGPEVEKLKTGMRLDPDELARTLRAWNEKLAGRAVAPETLIRQLAAAYRRLCLVRELAEGTRVFLLDLLGELVLLLQPESFRLNPAQEKFVEYPRVRFSHDLFRLKQAGVFRTGDRQLKLHVANFDATTEKARALWVPDNEDGDGTHYSYLSFVPAE